MREEIRGKRRIAVFLLGLLLLNFPLLRMMDAISPVIGWPVTVLYLFAAWALIVGLLWRLRGRRAERG